MTTKLLNIGDDPCDDWAPALEAQQDPEEAYYANGGFDQDYEDNCPQWDDATFDRHWDLAVPYPITL